MENTPSAPAPVLPKTGEATTSTLESYWNSFKDSVNKGYTYIKQSLESGYQYLKGQYDYITKNTMMRNTIQKCIQIISLQLISLY